MSVLRVKRRLGCSLPCTVAHKRSWRSQCLLGATIKTRHRTGFAGRDTQTTTQQDERHQHHHQGTLLLLVAFIAVHFTVYFKSSFTLISVFFFSWSADFISVFYKRNVSLVYFFFYTKNDERLALHYFR